MELSLYSLGIVENVTGVYGQTQLGSVIVAANSDVAVTGVNAAGAVGTVFVWGDINDNQNPNWQNIAGAQAPTWGNVSTGQTPNWQDIAA